MKELSIFIDESGDFGEYAHHAPFYIVAMVFYDKKNNIEQASALLEKELTYLGFPEHYIHTGPIIRKEEDYKNMYVEERKRILNKMMAFIRNAEISYHCLHIEKKQFTDVVEATGRLSKEISQHINNNLEYFLNYDKITVYYDNGQIELSKALSFVLNALLPNVVFEKAVPAKNRLSQVADTICTFELLRLKCERKMLSKSELRFFDGEKELKKNYLKHLRKKEV